MLGFELTEQQLELKALARRFSEQEIIPRAREYDEKEIFPRDICEKAFAAGLMNLGVPAELGGPGLGVLDSSLILEELNYGCSGIANFVGAALWMCAQYSASMAREEKRVSRHP